MPYEIYHNTRCRKSRAGLDYLEKKGIKPVILEYLKDKPFTKESLKQIIKKSNLQAKDLIRTQEEDYKSNYRGKSYTEDQWIEILVKNPKLIRRPIIVNGDKAVIGDIVEHIDALL